MSIWIGNTEITQMGKIQVGNKNVQEVWVGNTKVWPATIANFTWSYSITFRAGDGTASFIIYNSNSQVIFQDTVSGGGSKSGSVPQNVLDIIALGGCSAVYMKDQTFDGIQLYINSAFIGTLTANAYPSTINIPITSYESRNQNISFQ